MSTPETASTAVNNKIPFTGQDELKRLLQQLSRETGISAARHMRAAARIYLQDRFNAVLCPGCFGIVATIDPETRVCTEPKWHTHHGTEMTGDMLW